jgi:hypothetical protein
MLRDDSSCLRGVARRRPCVGGDRHNPADRLANIGATTGAPHRAAGHPPAAPGPAGAGASPCCTVSIVMIVSRAGNDRGCCVTVVESNTAFHGGDELHDGWMIAPRAG